jgi:plastocyanin
MVSLRWVVLVVVLSGLVAAGCGGEESDTTAGNEAQTGPQAETEKAPEASKPADQTVSISAEDFKFDPKNPRVNAGTVEFQLTNDGQAPHALEVEAPRGEVETDVIQPGESASVKADLGKSGSVVMYCPVGNHREMGMEGKIQVGSGGAASKDDSGPGRDDGPGDDRGGDRDKKSGDDDGGGGGSNGY